MLFQMPLIKVILVGSLLFGVTTAAVKQILPVKEDEKSKNVTNIPESSDSEVDDMLKTTKEKVTDEKQMDGFIDVDGAKDEVIKELFSESKDELLKNNNTENVHNEETEKQGVEEDKKPSPEDNHEPTEIVSLSPEGTVQDQNETLKNISSEMKPYSTDVADLNTMNSNETSREYDTVQETLGEGVSNNTKADTLIAETEHPAFGPQISAVILASIFVIFAIVGYSALLIWRKVLQIRYGNSEQLITDEEFYDVNDLRNFEI